MCVLSACLAKSSDSRGKGCCHRCVSEADACDIERLQATGGVDTFHVLCCQPQLSSLHWQFYIVFIVLLACALRTLQMSLLLTPAVAKLFRKIEHVVGVVVLFTCRWWFRVGDLWQPVSEKLKAFAIVRHNIWL